MLHDPDVYPNPSLFFPERFLDGEGKIDPQIRRPDSIVFGFGRRSVELSDLFVGSASTNM